VWQVRSVKRTARYEGCCARAPSSHAAAGRVNSPTGVSEP